MPIGNAMLVEAIVWAMVASTAFEAITWLFDAVADAYCVWKLDKESAETEWLELNEK